MATTGSKATTAKGTVVGADSAAMETPPDTQTEGGVAALQTETEDLAVAALRGKEELTSLVTAAMEQILAVDKSLARLARDGKEVARQRQEVTEELGARYDELLRWVHRSRDELLEATAAASDNALAGLKAEEMTARVAMDTLSHLVARAYGTSSSDPEVLVLKGELQAALLGEEDFRRYVTLGHREEQRQIVRLKVDSSVLDLAVVRAYMGELSSEDVESPCPSLWKQFQEMKDNAIALEAKLKSAEQQSADLEANINTIESRMDTAVAFHACHDKRSLNVPPRGTLVLNHTATNIGNAYDTTTGIFTVPVDGLYDFQATIVTDKTRAFVGLCVEDDVLAGGVADGGGSACDQGTFRAVVHVTKGQLVWLKNETSAAKYYCGSIARPFTSFSGFLIKAD